MHSGESTPLTTSVKPTLLKRKRRHKGGRKVLKARTYSQVRAHSDFFGTSACFSLSSGDGALLSDLFVEGPNHGSCAGLVLSGFKEPSPVLLQNAMVTPLWLGTVDFVHTTKNSPLGAVLVYVECDYAHTEKLPEILESAESHQRVCTRVIENIIHHRLCTWQKCTGAALTIASPGVG